MSFVKEFPLVFSGNYGDLVGIIHSPAVPEQTGVLIIVGGPQYRVGSHRQFVLLARNLADKGYPVMRFDYTGMGDSDGDLANFEAANDDIKSAIDIFFLHQPEIKKVVIWGLCDAASAALFYCCQDKRLLSLILLNPWVRTEEGEAKVYLKHYYLNRFCSADFWKKVLSGKWNVIDTTRSVIILIKKLFPNKNTGQSAAVSIQNASLPDRMADGFERFSGKILIILSGNNDYVADEFRELIASSARWKRLMKKNGISVEEIPEANHTFAKSDWRKIVEEKTYLWLKTLPHNKNK